MEVDLHRSRHSSVPSAPFAFAESDSVVVGFTYDPLHDSFDFAGRECRVRNHPLARALLGAAICNLGIACTPSDDASLTNAREAFVIDPDVTIGLVEGDPAYLFGDVVSVAVDEAGLIYVGDRIGATVRVYDGAGRHLKQIAREGQGPGEIYGRPADITRGPHGRIYVRDGSRITVFAPTASEGVADSVMATWATPGYGNLSSTRSRVGDSGEYYYPGYLFREEQHPRFFYLPFRDGTPTGDTLEVPAYPGLTGQRRAYYRMGPSDGRMLDGVSHVPFAPLPVWDVTHAGTILSSSGSEYTLIETDMRGDTVRVITGPTTELVDIPPAERADSARALDVRLDTLPVPLDKVIGLGEGVRERRLPTTLPPVIGIHVAADRSIWVERWPSEGDTESRSYDVLGDDGQLRGRVVLRAPLSRDPPPFFGTNFVVGVVNDPDTNVERVVRFTVAAERAIPIDR